MTERIWKFQIDEKPHTVALTHGIYSGKRLISLDGEVIESSQKLFDSGSQHNFRAAGHPCQLGITTNGITFDYYLLVDNVPVTALGLEDRQPSRAVQRALDAAAYWQDLARRLGLYPTRASDQTPVLAGELDGYFMVIHPATVKTSQRERSMLAVWVRHAPEDLPEETFDRLKKDLEMIHLLGEDLKNRLPFNSGRGIKYFLLPFDKKASLRPGDIATHIRTFTRLVSRYCRPIETYTCDGSDCQQNGRDQLELIMVNAIPTLSCAACLENQAQANEEARVNFQHRPIGMVWLFLAAFAAIPLMALLQAAVGAWMGIGVSMLAGVVTYSIIVRSAPYLGVKPTGWTMLIALLAALVQIAMGDFFTRAALLVRHDFWAPTPAVLIRAAQIVFVEQRQVWSHITLAAIFIGLLALSNIWSMKLGLRSAFTKQVSHVSSLDFLLAHGEKKSS